MNELQPTADNEEQRIASRIAVLKEQYPNKTRELYRAVITMLFFEFGQRPTGNRLLSLVGKGSANVPGEVLSEFWEDVRKKARVDINHPGVPMELRQFGADIIAGFWTKAIDSARQEFATQKFDIEAGRTRVENELARVQQELDSLKTELDETRAAQKVQAEAARKTEESLRAELISERKARSGADATVQELQTQLEHGRAQLKQMQAAFSQDLERAQNAVRASDERALGAERRALMEIERERSGSARIREEAQELRNQVRRGEEREKQMLQSHERQIAAFQETTQILRAEKQLLQSSLDHKTSESEQLSRELLVAQQETLRYRTQAEAIQQTVEQLKKLGDKKERGSK